MNNICKRNGEMKKLLSDTKFSHDCKLNKYQTWHKCQMSQGPPCYNFVKTGSTIMGSIKHQCLNWLVSLVQQLYQSLSTSTSLAQDKKYFGLSLHQMAMSPRMVNGPFNEALSVEVDFVWQQWCPVTTCQGVTGCPLHSGTCQRSSLKKNRAGIKSRNSSVKLTF